MVGNIANETKSVWCFILVTIMSFWSYLMLCVSSVIFDQTIDILKIIASSERDDTWWLLITHNSYMNTHTKKKKERNKLKNHGHGSNTLSRKKKKVTLGTFAVKNDCGKK